MNWKVNICIMSLNAKMLAVNLNMGVRCNVSCPPIGSNSSQTDKLQNNITTITTATTTIIILIIISTDCISICRELASSILCNIHNNKVQHSLNNATDSHTADVFCFVFCIIFIHFKVPLMMRTICFIQCSRYWACGVQWADWIHWAPLYHTALLITAT